jgi:hypothetical protein
LQSNRTSDLSTNRKYIEINKLDRVKISHMILLTSIVGSLNVLFYKNYLVSMIIIAIEVIVLMYYFMRKDITRYIGNYLVFLCLSFEFNVLVGSEQFYGFKNFRIFGVNMGIIALLPILLLAINKKIKIKNIKKNYPKLYKFVIMISVLSITGVAFGLFSLLINDNNIQNMNGFLESFIGVVYTMVALPFLIIVAILYILTWEKEKVSLLADYLISILIGVVVSMIVSLISGNFGWYGGVETLLVSNVIRYVPFMVLFPMYRNVRYKKIVLVFSIVGVILTLMFNATGKIIIIYMCVPIVVYMILMKRKKRLSLLIMLLILPVGIILSIKGINMLTENSLLFNIKFTQATSIIKFWQANWLSNMPGSPQTRIVEFINIGNEYLNKPWFFLFGKGYMGTITDHVGMLGNSFSLTGYSLQQWVNGTFYGVHETLNVLFLYNGLFGLGCYLYMLILIFSNLTKSPWILIGGFWFLMVYGFSITMTAFGITALLVGYIEIDKSEVLY